MRRDTIFYQLFGQSPSLLFELLEAPPENAAEYRFDAISVKEARFEIDGVFLPPETAPPGTVFFCEVQFQTDEELYERMFAELFLYFRQNRARFRDWQAVAIYPSRSIEQEETLPYQDLLDGPRMHRIYLNELGDVAQLPLGVALMVLTTLTERRTPDAARLLLNRAQTEMPAPENRGIIEMITTIMVYRFTSLSRQEIEQMLGTRLQETRVYQEAKQEGRQQEAAILVLRLLTHKFGTIPTALVTRIEQLPLEQLETLSLAWLGFQNLEDLETWLQGH